jgi:hypothetical protein
MTHNNISMPDQFAPIPGELTALEKLKILRRPVPTPEAVMASKEIQKNAKVLENAFAEKVDVDTQNQSDIEMLEKAFAKEATPHPEDSNKTLQPISFEPPTLDLENQVSRPAVSAFSDIKPLSIAQTIEAIPTTVENNTTPIEIVQTNLEKPLTSSQNHTTPIQINTPKAKPEVIKTKIPALTGNSNGAVSGINSFEEYCLDLLVDHKGQR